MTISSFEGKAAEEEGGGKGGAQLIFPKEKGEPVNSLWKPCFNNLAIFYGVHFEG